MWLEVGSSVPVGVQEDERDRGGQGQRTREPSMRVMGIQEQTGLSR